jgi:hypothetical protein
MSVHKLAKYEADYPYTRVPNAAVNDPNLDLKARGLLLLMLSKPDGWVFRERSLAKQAGVGRDQLRAAIQRLMEAGYVIRRWESVDGRPVAVTEVYDTSQSEVGKPEVGKPDRRETLPLSNEVVEVKKEDSKPTKRQTSMTSDWQPDPANWQRICTATKGVDHTTELENFRDHYISKAEKRADWNASLRTWMRNAEKWKRTNPADPPANPPRVVGPNGYTFCQDCDTPWSDHDEESCKIMTEAKYAYR